jgi:hypothetical protein
MLKMISDEMRLFHSAALEVAQRARDEFFVMAEKTGTLSTAEIRS